MINLIKSILRKDRHYHMAVSMGVDSVAALLWLYRKGYSVTPIHFNHNIRPQNGIMMKKFYELCDTLCTLGIAETGGGLSTENECRGARLDFYSRVAPGGTIITAHHVNDWVESYIMNCFRGHCDKVPFELESKFPDFTISHPFLLCKKSDFRVFVERNGWSSYVVEDDSNFLIKGSRRNWLRNSIIPSMAGQKVCLNKYAVRRIMKQVETVDNDDTI